jgi:hypothetical protein
MKKAFLLVSSLIFVSSLSLFSEKNSFLENEAGEFKMTLLLESEHPTIKEYEIEFWKEVENKKSVELPIQKILKPGRNVLVAPPSYHFFRVRAIALWNVRGYFTEFYPIKRYPLEKEAASVKTLDVPRPSPISNLFIKIGNETGKEDLFLASKLFSFKDQMGKQSSIFYRFGKMNWQKWNEEDIQIPEDGEYKLEYYGIDVLGNKEGVKQITFFSDSTPPVSAISFASEQFVHPHFLFVPGDFNLNLLAYDSGSGVDRIFYRVGCELPLRSEWIIFSQSLRLKDIQVPNCKEKIFFEYFARDKIGNSESQNIKEIHLSIVNGN